MPKQSTVSTGRKPRKGGRAGSQAGVQRERQDGSSTLVAKPTPSDLKLNIRNPSGNSGDQVQQEPANLAPVTFGFAGGAQFMGTEEDAEGEEDYKLPIEEMRFNPVVAEPTQSTTRSGRTVKRTYGEMFALGSEIDNIINTSSVGKADDDYEEAEYVGPPSSPLRK